MDIHAWIAIGTLVVAMVLFISKLIPLEATALSIPVVLAVTGTVNPAEAALRGFGNNAVIALGAIFVLSAGLKESGVATLMGRMLERFGGKKEWSLVLLIMITTCVLSGDHVERRHRGGVPAGGPGALTQGEDLAIEVDDAPRVLGDPRRHPHPDLHHAEPHPRQRARTTERGRADARDVRVRDRRDSHLHRRYRLHGADRNPIARERSVRR